MRVTQLFERQRNRRGFAQARDRRLPSRRNGRLASAGAMERR
jgi:hypothetical protein